MSQIASSRAVKAALALLIVVIAATLAWALLVDGGEDGGGATEASPSLSAEESAGMSEGDQPDQGASPPAIESLRQRSLR